jgi:hypothetical protein
MSVQHENHIQIRMSRVVLAIHFGAAAQGQPPTKKLCRNPEEPDDFSVGKIGFGEDFVDHAVPAELAADSGNTAAVILVSLVAGLVGGCPWSFYGHSNEW